MVNTVEEIEMVRVMVEDTMEVEVVVAVVKAMVVATSIVPKQMANQIPTMITIVSQWEERRNECHDGGGNNLNDDLW